LKWGLNQRCSLHQELSNDISHVTYTQGNRVDSWPFVIESQIVNLTIDFSFRHNLCFKCPNGLCEPILDIYVPRAFQWYNELLKPKTLLMVLCYDLNSINVIPNCNLSICWWNYFATNVHLRMLLFCIYRNWQW
jgi:hypothetical protein